MNKMKQMEIEIQQQIELDKKKVLKQINDESYEIKEWCEWNAFPDFCDRKLNEFQAELLVEYYNRKFQKLHKKNVNIVCGVIEQFSKPIQNIIFNYVSDLEKIAIDEILDVSNCLDREDVLIKLDYKLHMHEYFEPLNTN